jgi:hypothetical protein
MTSSSSVNDTNANVAKPNRQSSGKDVKLLKANAVITGHMRQINNSRS